MHEPEERELLFLPPSMVDFWLLWCLTSHWMLAQWCIVIYSPLLQSWIGSAVLTQITGKVNFFSLKCNVGTQPCHAEILLDLKVTYSFLEIP